MRLLGLDIENPGGAISRIGFAEFVDGQRIFAKSMIWTPLAARETRRLCASADVIAIHNCAYDIPHLANAGVLIPIAKVFDTMLAAQIDEPDLPKGLGSAAWRYIGPMYPWKHLSDADPGFYNMLDADTAALMALSLIPKLRGMGIYEHFRTNIIPSALAIQRMTDRGIRVDKAKLAEFSREAIARADTAEERWTAMTDDVNPRSTKQLVSFFEAEGMPVQINTKTRKPSTDAQSIQRMRKAAQTERHKELLDTLALVRGAGKMKSTYARDQGIGPDGCLHPTYLPASKDFQDDGQAILAASGRLTAKPNIQNQPPAARVQYVPHHADWLIGETDWSAVEDRIVAFASGNRAAMEAYRSGADLHEIRAATYGVDRKRAKTIRYGTLYGLGVTKIAERTNSTVADVQIMLARYAEANPAEREWIDAIVAEATAYCRLANGFGRHRRFYGMKSDSDKVKAHTRNQAVNFIPQSSTADMMWTLIWQLDEAVEARGGHLLTQVHDSIVWEAPPDQVERVAADVRELMECEWPMIAENFSVPIETKIGANWGETTPMASA